MNLKIITPVRLLVDRQVESVSLPGLEGELGIYPGHAPFFISLAKGDVKYRIGGSEESVAVNGGYAQVLPDGVVIIAEGPGDVESRSSS